MKNHLWKILGVALVFYAVFMGLNSKVGPGIADVQPSSLKSGSQNSILIKGYNTSFTKSENKVRIKRGDFIHQASSVQVKEDNVLIANFDITSELHDSLFRKKLTLLIESETDGLYGSSNSIELEKTESIETFPIRSDSVIHKSKTYFAFPFRHLLHETIRNLNFHVPMWFVMITLMIISFVQSLKYLRTNEIDRDHSANAFATIGVVFGIAGIITGAWWARFTWGPFWTNDPKLNGAAIGVMIYAAYLVLRSSIEETDKKARISAVYNVFAFPIFIVLILIYPKLASHSLHPGSGDSVGFDTYDLDNDLRKVFYPAVLGWILMGIWMAQLKTRLDRLIWKTEE